MVFSCCVRLAGIPDRSAQAVESELRQAVPGPLLHVGRLRTLPAAPAQEPEETRPHERIDLNELGRCVAGPEVISPAAQDGVEILDDLSKIIHARPAPSIRDLANAAPDAIHAPHRGPPEEVLLLPEVRPHDPQMAPEEVEPLLAESGFHDPTLLGMQRETQLLEDDPQPPHRLVSVRL